MADSKCTARTNYVRVKDIDAAMKSLEPFDVDVYVHETQKDALMVGNEHGGSVSLSRFDEAGKIIHIGWGDWCKAHLLEGQILVIQEVCAEKLRYTSGYAAAYSQNGEYVCVRLDSALDSAIKAKFGDVKYAGPNYSEVVV